MHDCYFSHCPSSEVFLAHFGNIVLLIKYSRTFLNQWTKPHYSYFSRFGHLKAVLTNVLLKMDILMLETC
jgi:hypothetical protein